MGRHWTEERVEDAVAAFALGQGMRGFSMNRVGDKCITFPLGNDARATYHGREVMFEIKAAQARVRDASKPNGTRPGRFRVDPQQYPGVYGTSDLWFVLVVYDVDSPDLGEVVSMNIVRSDQLPQRETVISLSASSLAKEVQ